MTVLCSETIWTGKTTSTYCMRDKGHDGNHSIRPDVKTPAKLPLTKDVLLTSNYGPYKDGRSQRDGNMRLNKDEQLCTVCDGAGTAPSTVDWVLNVCKGCNGHGVIAFDKFQKRPVKFDVEAKVATKMVRIGE